MVIKYFRIKELLSLFAHLSNINFYNEKDLSTNHNKTLENDIAFG